jgi:hypothetical protein
MCDFVYKSGHMRIDCDNSICTDKEVAWFLLKLLLLTLYVQQYDARFETHGLKNVRCFVSCVHTVTKLKPQGDFSYAHFRSTDN